jgi:hypothetical protein
VDQLSDAGILEDAGCLQALGPLPAGRLGHDFRFSP